jgi:hypothetical protein
MLTNCLIKTQGKEISTVMMKIMAMNKIPKKEMEG